LYSSPNVGFHNAGTNFFKPVRDMSVEEWDLEECPYLTGASLLVDGGMMAGL
jgi:hypothetical protein